jgi:exodeoxyribonuclease VII large subunit
VRLPRQRAVLEDLELRGNHAFQNRLLKAADRLRNAGSLLASYSHQSVLERGFALVRDQVGKPITSAAAAAGESKVEIEFADGRTPALIAGDFPVKSKSSRKKPKDGDGGQGRLL